MKQGAALLLFAAILNAAATAHGGDAKHSPTTFSAESGERRIEVTGSRIKGCDVVSRSGPGTGTCTFTGESLVVDLGPAPVIGSSRLIEKREIEKAFVDAGMPVPKKIPAKVRVWRKSKKLDAAAVGQAVRQAATKLPHRAELIGVTAPAVEVPAEFDHVAIEMPNAPRKAGIVTLHAPITFVDASGAPLQRGVVTLKLSLPPEAAFAEIAKGAPITLIVKKGLVEVSVVATAGTDADVGAVLPVTIKPSGRVIRARAIDKDHAVSVEDS